MNPERTDALTVVDYLRPVWRFRFVVVIVIVVAAAATYEISRHEQKSYTAATELYLGESNAQQLLNPQGVLVLGARNVADDSQLLQSVSVATVAKQIMGSPYSPEALLGAISVSPSEVDDFLTISSQGSDPRFVASVVNAFADAYLSVAASRVASSAKAQVNSIRRQLARASTPELRVSLSSQLASAQELAANPPTVGQQVAPATPPAVAISPKPTRNAIFAGVLALVLCVIACYVVARGDRRVRRVSEVEALLGLPILASLPRSRMRARPNTPLVMPPSLREPFRTLRVNLDLARAQPGGKVILVSSAVAAEGRSTTVSHLAITYMEVGMRVAVVEADLRQPVLADWFNLKAAPGLTELLLNGEDVEPQAVLAPSTDPGIRLGGAEDDHARNATTGGVLDVVVAGDVIVGEDPTAVLTQPRIRNVLKQLVENYDIVLIDSPPLLAVSDALPLLSLVDGVLIVTRLGTSTQDATIQLRRTVERISSFTVVRVLGAVVNYVTDDTASTYFRSDRKPEVRSAGTVRPSGTRS